jgi:hypothetical protein
LRIKEEYWIETKGLTEWVGRVWQSAQSIGKLMLLVNTKRKKEERIAAETEEDANQSVADPLMDLVRQVRRVSERARKGEDITGEYSELFMATDLHVLDEFLLHIREALKQLDNMSKEKEKQEQLAAAKLLEEKEAKDREKSRKIDLNKELQTKWLGLERKKRALRTRSNELDEAREQLARERQACEQEADELHEQMRMLVFGDM